MGRGGAAASRRDESAGVEAGGASSRCTGGGGSGAGCGCGALTGSATAMAWSRLSGTDSTGAAANGSAGGALSAPGATAGCNSTVGGAAGASAAGATSGAWVSTTAGAVDAGSAGGATGALTAVGGVSSADGVGRVSTDEARLIVDGRFKGWGLSAATAGSAAVRVRRIGCTVAGGGAGAGAGGDVPTEGEDGRDRPAPGLVAAARRFTTVGAMRCSTTVGVLLRSRLRLTRSIASSSTALM